MIRIIDYGVGNIQAFLTLFKRQGIAAARASTPEELQDATRLILPGVGHFDHAMQRLNDSGLRSELERLVKQESVPIIGICVGMQMLSDGSDEGGLPGLGWIPGRVRSLSENSLVSNLPMPHMGWNTLRTKPSSRLFKSGFDDDPQFYFLHSFYFDADDKNSVAASAFYGLDFDAVVSSGHIHGIQCHPEKSHHWGAQLLKNFAEFG
ncbi:imidazole glycerol phosphate synthase subunit HisH [Alkalimarinus sediminis]|uniref:Imidazole glycerol phosphate synthase subunit HisH n=1 Tax=Alkalimarinus sediminis TaxID=1632866 RepID=A0A9E8HN98_9ALTE|nr:imidazole glycerol phosphate synthase subunit HisH [Alkalimarinus sediminis]UZW73421.1 imidazole glycerol phosphate synthase subunit HisH [Alkalimarinus sediminis]